MEREKRKKETIDKQELLEILTKVKPGLSHKDIVEQASHFIFTGEEIVTYNDQICISHPFKTDFKCSVNADNLFKILSGVPGDDVEIKFDGTQLEITGKKFKAGLAVSVEETIYTLFSDIRIGFRRGWKEIPSDFMEGLFLCMFSASMDMTTRTLTGVGVLDDSMVSSDDYRLSKYKLDVGVGTDFLIPAKAIFELKGYDFKEYKVSESWIHFRTENGVVFSIRLIEGSMKEFDFEQYFEVDGAELVLPEKLASVLETVSIMAEGDFDFEKKIEIIVDGNKVICKGRKSQGWVEIEEKLEGENEAVSFFINPIFLKQILQKTNSVIIGEGRALFKSDKFEHVMLLSVGNE